MMEWSYFYDKYSEWSKSKLKSCISLLKDIDSGSELADVVADIDDDTCKVLLIQKALEFQVAFEPDDFETLDGEIPSELFVRLAQNGNISFGTSEEVAQVLENIYDKAGSDVLYQRAVKSGIRFTHEPLKMIGRCDETYDSASPESHPRGCGCLCALFGIGLLFDGSNHKETDPSAKKDNGRCSGNCADCPPHYGYRFGIWYYGHGHQHGCQRGGNGGATGKCRRD